MRVSPGSPSQMIAALFFRQGPMCRSRHWVLALSCPQTNHFVSGIAPDIAEQRLSIHLLGDAATEANWVLFTDAVVPEDIGQHTAVRRSTSIVDVLAWCHFNRIIAGDTQITAYAGAQPYSARELRSILGALEGTFPGGLLGSSDCTDLTRAPQLLRAALFVNVGLEHRPGLARVAHDQHLGPRRGGLEGRRAAHRERQLRGQLGAGDAPDAVRAEELAGHYLFENCGRLRAFFNPALRRSLALASRVSRPRRFRSPRSSGSISVKARAMPCRTAPACPRHAPCPR